MWNLEKININLEEWYKGRGKRPAEEGRGITVGNGDRKICSKEFVYV
jgi:hypothetical protein